MSVLLKTTITIVDGATFELEPRLVSLSIQVGSRGGSLIEARVEGIGQISTQEFMHCATSAWQMPCLGL